jgi:hypothetical protein
MFISHLVSRVLSYQIELVIIIGCSVRLIHVIFTLMVSPYHGLPGLLKMGRIYTITRFTCIQDIDIHFMQERVMEVLLDLCGWHCMIIMVLMRGSILDRIIVKLVM